MGTLYFFNTTLDSIDALLLIYSKFKICLPDGPDYGNPSTPPSSFGSGNLFP